MSRPSALVANFATHPDDLARTTRLNPFDNHIPCNWDVWHH